MAELSIGRQIGRGGMAEVHLGTMRGLGGFTRLVVEKRILPAVARDPLFERMFLDEARLAAVLDHPGIVGALDVGRDARGLFLVMEYVSGESLAYVFHHLRHAGEVMPWPLVCRIGIQLAAALGAAHGATDAHGRHYPIVHRDVTPSNVLVSWAGQVKLADFGIAKALGATQTQSGRLKGKLSYLAPEQLAGRPVGVRTDVFQLGIVLHELLTGQRLFDATSEVERVRAVKSRPIRPPSEIRRELPRALDRVVMAVLERDPGKRTASAEAARCGLEAVLAELGVRPGEAELGGWMTRRFVARLAERRRIEREAMLGTAARDGAAPTQGRPEAASANDRLTPPGPPPRPGAGRAASPGGPPSPSRHPGWAPHGAAAARSTVLERPAAPATGHAGAASAAEREAAARVTVLEADATLIGRVPSWPGRPLALPAGPGRALATELVPRRSPGALPVRRAAAVIALGVGLGVGLAFVIAPPATHQAPTIAPSPSSSPSSSPSPTPALSPTPSPSLPPPGPPGRPGTTRDREGMVDRSRAQR